MEWIGPDAVFHVAAPEPDRSSASERRVTCGEDDLFVGAHPQHFMRQDQPTARKLF